MCICFQFCIAIRLHIVSLPFKIKLQQRELYFDCWYRSYSMILLVSNICTLTMTVVVSWDDFWWRYSCPYWFLAQRYLFNHLLDHSHRHSRFTKKYSGYYWILFLHAPQLLTRRDDDDFWLDLFTVMKYVSVALGFCLQQCVIYLFQTFATISKFDT